MMRALYHAEWLRLTRHAVTRWTLLALASLLTAAAAWSGRTAAEHRARAAEAQAELRSRIAAAAAGAPSTLPSSASEGQKAAEAAFGIGRGELAATHLPALGGLVLGVQQYAAVPTSLRASLEVRHTDGRPLGTLRNPLLAETGLPGFPTVLVLLLPLAALAVTAGTVQEDRERTTWRLVRAQACRPLWRVVAVALSLRFAALLLLAAAASALAFSLDPGSTADALVQWGVALALFTAFWVLVGGALSLLPVSAGAAATAALGVWLALTFATPALLAWRAARTTPMPSRLAAIVRLRAVQLETEERDAALLRGWYEAHPRHRPLAALAPATPTWPVTF